MIGTTNPRASKLPSRRKKSLMPLSKTSSEPQTSDATPTSEENGCEGLSAGPPSGSVYDFLYQDVRRVGSFLAQFDEYGVRQSVKATESTGRTQTVKGTASGTVGLPAVLGGSATVDATTADETKDLAEHTFDPLWANSRRLLDYLHEHDLIEYDAWEARLGRFVIIEGPISVIDANLLTPIFLDPDLFDSLLAQACREANTDPASPEGQEFRRGMNVVSTIPKAIHLYVFKPQSYTWATLTAESLVTSAHDIAFKHGALMRGHWKVLGILDAWPDHRNEPSDDDPDPKTLDELGANILPEGLLKIAANLTNIARNVTGRPRDYFGVTPLLIFREVSGE
ncbi:hypothetical protein [Methylobacterium sp. WL9]|uniref:DUF6414 family protein n=1 Tax=Methylobacterium sp. WL9 TaxID=2603898 RepID=UPI0011C7E173|nr:hypothetical protein [Methylobacterium sp. WL9]TXN20031.1 hypothetical protein FV217_19370 [Methylobacterium sp. WL9]